MPSVRASQPNLENFAARLAPRFAGLHCLSDVVAWLAASGGERRIVDVVIQDEYTHDIVVRYSGDVYLVYDVT